MAIPPVQVGNVVPSASLLGADALGVNETHIGLVDLPTGRARAYIKVMHGRQLVNELFATTLGRALGLPIPEGCLVRARPSDLPDSSLLRDYGAEAILFASRETVAPDLKRRIKDGGAAAIGTLFESWKDWASCMTFDEWVANVDRHPGNILFGGPGDIWLIDHGHCFSGADWTLDKLVPKGTWKNQIAEIRIPTLTLPERVETKQRIAGMIPQFGALNCTEAYTACHLPIIMPASEGDGLLSFVNERVSHIYDILSSRLGIPNLGEENALIA